MIVWKLVNKPAQLLYQASNINPTTRSIKLSQQKSKEKGVFSLMSSSNVKPEGIKRVEILRNGM